MGDPAEARRTLEACRLSEHPGPDSQEPPAVSGNADLAGHKKSTGRVFINGVANKQSDFIMFYNSPVSCKALVTVSALKP